MYKSILTLFSILALITSTAHAAGDAEAGKAKAAACVSCHGMDGNSANPEWPKLAGQHAGYIAKQLADFKAADKGGRNNAIMAGMTATLSEQDMADLGAWFESQAISSGMADKHWVKVGEHLYRGGNKAAGVAACIACHGPRGAGNPAAGYPAVAGQHITYTINQLNAFRTGTRHNDAGGVMRDNAVRLTEDEVKAVAEYLAGLH